MQSAEEFSRRRRCFRPSTVGKIRTQDSSNGPRPFQIIVLARFYASIVFLAFSFLTRCAAIEVADPTIHLDATLERSRHELVIEPLDGSPYREGYLTLRWSDHPGTSRYRVVGSNGTIYYEGPNAEAFLSGLKDGEYRLAVEGLDSDGSVVVRSSLEEGLIVEHWSSTLVLTLLGTGGLVVSVLAILIVWGTRLSSISPPATSVALCDDGSSTEELSPPSTSQAELTNVDRDKESLQ